MKVLIIEDEKALSESIFAYLQTEHFTCETALDLNQPREKSQFLRICLYHPELNLPGGSGLVLLRELKSNHNTEGDLIISARNLLNKTWAFDEGADDYLTKPFHLSELAAQSPSSGVNLLMERQVSGSVASILIFRKKR